MTTLPEPYTQQPHAAAPAGQPINPAAQAFIAQVEDALKEATKPALAIPTSFRNDALPSTPTIGDAPPIEQPGRPAMSKAASDVSGVMIASSVPILALGAAATGILWGSGQANSEVIGWICAGLVTAPAAIAAPILALKSLMKSAKQAAEAAPPVIHQHYTGDVHQDQRQVNTTNRAIIATTRNQLPR